MTVVEATGPRAAHPEWIRPAVWACGAVAGVAAALLFALQLASVATPCVVPACVWPRLSADGFASLEAVGLPAWTWVVVAGTASAVWWAVPFAFGVLFATSRTAPPAVAILWFAFSLGTFSAVPSDPVVQGLLRVVALGAWFTVFATFPTGRFVPRWVVAAPVVAVAWTIVLTTPAVRAAEASNDPLWWALEAAVYIVCVAVIVAGLSVQYRRGDPGERRRIRLLLAAFAPFLALGMVGIIVNATLDADAFGYGTLGGAVLYEASSFLTIVLIACVAVATLRHGAYGVRVAVDRVLVGTLALALAVVVYTAAVLLASLIAPDGVAQAVAAIVTAVLLARAYSQLARTIGRLVHGDADDPSAVGSALARTVAAATGPEELGPRIAAELAERLRFPGVAVRASDPADVRGESGRMDGRRAAVALTLDDRVVGRIDVTLRAGQRRLTSRDRTALAATAGPLATAVTASRLSADVRRSRFAVVAGRDEERRMLRRRLHDDVGPTLALAGHRIAAAHDDAAQLDAAAQNVDDAVAQVRAISRELRPPALDEGGLRAALSAFAEGVALPTTISAPERVNPAVVEVALYRIAVEALLNAVRHAHADRATITVRSLGGSMLVEVDDDGIGLSGAEAPGVGTLSMRERAMELGGSLTLGRSPLGGLRVHAEIPTGTQESE